MVTAVFLGWAIVSQVAIPHQPRSDSRRLTIEGTSGLCFPEPADHEASARGRLAA